MSFKPSRQQCHMDPPRRGGIFSGFIKFLIVEALVETGKKSRNNIDKLLVDFIVKRREEKPMLIKSLLAIGFCGLFL